MRMHDLAALMYCFGTQTRMNGGTNIGLAIEKGGDMMSHLPADVSRVIVVLSDFRVDQWASEGPIPSRMFCLHHYSYCLGRTG